MSTLKSSPLPKIEFFKPNSFRGFVEIYGLKSPVYVQAEYIDRDISSYATDIFTMFMYKNYSKILIEGSEHLFFILN